MHPKGEDRMANSISPDQTGLHSPVGEIMH